MDSARVRRRPVALLAAYAVALQALLTALIPVAPTATGPLAVLCTHDAGGSGPPAQHDPPCAAMCAALGHGLAGPMPPEFVAAIVRPQAMLALAPRSDWMPPRRVLAGPQSPRAPPLA